MLVRLAPLRSQPLPSAATLALAALALTALALALALAGAAASTCCFAWCISTMTSDDRELLSGAGEDVTHGKPNIFFATHECALPLMER